MRKFGSKVVLVCGILASVLNMGICNKYDEMCGGIGISKCISFYESSCKKGNLVACAGLDDSNIIDKVTFEKKVCLSYNGSVIDSVKKVIKDLKEIKSFIPNSVDSQKIHKHLAYGILELEIFLKNQTQQTKEWQSEKMKMEKKILARCAGVGDLLWDTDINESIQYYKKACDYGYSKSCETLGNIYQDDKSVSPNYLLALEYHEKACDLGVKDSCDKYIQLRKQSSNDNNP
ncbi:tetratricopeptide repeat protein [Helicobacter sp. T3_23-1056]